MSKKLITPAGSEIALPVSATHKAPKIKGVHPFGSKILVEALNPDEVLGTNLFVGKDTQVEGAPQAYIVELGPQIPADSGLQVGQRIYWTGKGTQVSDPRQTNRVRALLEPHNVMAIIEEDSECCGGHCHA